MRKGSVEQARFNLAMADKHRNWYELQDQVQDAMAEYDRVYEARLKAGWVDDGDEDGSYWLVPHPETTELTPLTELEDEFPIPYPEDA